MRPRYEDDRSDPHAWRAELDRPPADAAAPTPLEWLADHALLDPLDQPWTTPTRAVPVAGSPRPGEEADAAATGPVGAQRPRPVPYRRRRDDEAGVPATDPAGAATTEHPAHRAGARPVAPAAAPPVPPVTARPAPRPDTAGHTRLSEILAESAAPPAGRRRRRYREDDEPDEVLSRVLRGG
jgi:hypothetical protein